MQTNQVPKRIAPADLQIRYTEYESEEWAQLSTEGWRTYEVYADGECLLIYQKYLH